MASNELDVAARRVQFCEDLTTDVPPFCFIPSGSAFELPFFHKRAPTDIDVMAYHLDFIGIPDDGDMGLPTLSFNGRWTRLLKFTGNFKPGYARMSKEDSEFVWKRELNWTFFKLNYGPAKRWCMEDICVEVQKMFGGSSSIKHLDAVYCIRCIGWPAVAGEWATRIRPSGWPSEDLIKSVVSGDYHFVHKAHPHYAHDKHMWRLSFSKAEVMLITSWRSEQKFLYFVLKQIKKTLETRSGGAKETALCSYYFKTLMLWECERRPKEFWDYDNAEASIDELLSTMVQWLVEKKCPNYFVPDNNMFEGVDDIGKDARRLIEYLESDEFIFHKKCMKSDIPDGRLVDVSDFDKLFLQDVYRLIPMSDDSELGERFKADKEQLFKLFDGLRGQRDLLRFTCKTRIGKQLVYTREYESREAVWSITEENFLKSMILQCIDPEQTTKFLEILRQSNMNDIKTMLNDETFFFSKVNFKFNTCLYVSAAYLANFYRRTTEVFCQAEKFSQVIVDLATERLMHRAVAESSSWPMLLSTEWSDIFDENVQAIFGFRTLYEAVLGDNNEAMGFRRPPIKICPMLFAHYINVQCGIQKKCNEDVIQNRVHSFMEQRDEFCPTDGHHHYGMWDDIATVILDTAVRLAIGKHIVFSRKKRRKDQ